MNKLIKILKQIIYWTTVIMPVVDGVKTVAQCLQTGIEQGKEDVKKAKYTANKAKFDDANSNVEVAGVTISYDSRSDSGDE